MQLHHLKTNEKNSTRHHTFHHIGTIHTLSRESFLYDSATTMQKVCNVMLLFLAEFAITLPTIGLRSPIQIPGPFLRFESGRDGLRVIGRSKQTILITGEDATV